MGNSQQPKPCCKLSGEGECVCPHSVGLHDFVWTTRVHRYKTVTVIMVVSHPTSSLAMVMLSWTSPNTVGWMKYPLSAAIPPPHISLAPSLFPLLMYPRILLNCSWSIWRVYWKKGHRLYVTVQSIDSENDTDFMCTWGPCSVLRLKGSPTTRFLARSTLRSTNSS